MIDNIEKGSEFPKEQEVGTPFFLLGCNYLPDGLYILRDDGYWWDTYGAYSMKDISREVKS